MYGYKNGISTDRVHYNNVIKTMHIVLLQQLLEYIPGKHTHVLTIRGIFGGTAPSR